MHSNNNTLCGFKELNSVFSGIYRYLNKLPFDLHPACTHPHIHLLNVYCCPSFLEHVVSTSGVCGYETGEINLTCELHGYQSSLSPHVWLNTNGSEITTSTKYTITSDEGSKTIVFENGTAIPSLIVSLTIRNLSSADGGNYTCRGVRG